MITEIASKSIGSLVTLATYLINDGVNFSHNKGSIFLPNKSKLFVDRYFSAKGFDTERYIVVEKQ
jgi:hypothetical protein